MKILFRTDSSYSIGSGHVFRCLTLADDLRQRGAEVTFVCREFPGNMIGAIEGKGYKAVRLPSPHDLAAAAADAGYAGWLGAPWEEDAKETVAVLQGGQADWLVVDHYGVDHRWEKAVRPHMGKILSIDDLADRPHDCDLLLDQNLYEGMEGRYDGLIPEGCPVLLGPKFALLRPEFADARKALSRRDGSVKRVLVFFGGSDSTGETEKALEALSGIGATGLEIDVVVGASNPRKGEIEAFCARHEAFRFHCQTGNMAELLARADLAIGGGGTTTWERCSLGLPSIVVAVAENQEELARCGAENGLFLYLGREQSVTAERIREVFRVVSSTPELLKSFSRHGLSFVDGRGAQRVAGLLMPPRITLRRAGPEDCDAIYEWRNAEETRRYIFDKTVIPLESHRAWFRKTLGDPGRILLVGETDGRPVGVLRYDFTGDAALISVYLVPGQAGRGVGSELIRSGSRWIREHRPEITKVIAEIFRENQASVRAFEQAGYTEHHLTYEEVL